jgi:hypothetical protein
LTLIIAPRRPFEVALRTTPWPFVASVVELLPNDFWLKYAFPGATTGKLSDFAGIGIVTLLLMAAFPRRQLYVGTLIVSGFSIWKRPLSQPLIDAADAYLP